MAEPPYGVIWNKLKAGKIVPFLGAGASMVARDAESKWEPKDPKFLPSGYELSRFLADEASFPSQKEGDKNDLAKVASYYAAVSGTKDLRGRLHEVLSREYTPGPLHKYLASIPTPLLIVTTNYDTLLEQAFQAEGKEYDLVIHPPSGKKETAKTVWWWKHGATEPIDTAADAFDPDLLKEKTVIYKMHGTIKPGAPNWDSFVITEEDYVDFLSRMSAGAAIPKIFYEHFRMRSFLFLGYGLGDWNMRVVLKDLDNYLKRERLDEEDEAVPSWAIQRNPSELESTLWSKRKVNIFDMPLDDFVTKMRERS